MTESRTRNILRICEQAMVLESEEQQRFNQQACGDDTQSLKSVASIIRAVTAAGNFLETPAVNSALAGQFTGSEIEPYRIIETLRVGDMGTVYLAVRGVEDCVQRVAIFRNFTPKSDVIIVGEVCAMVELADTYDWEGESAQAEKIL